MEKIPIGLTPEQQQKAEDEERYKYWMENHPEIEIAPENRRECDPEITELEDMMTLFESNHSLTELYSIVDLVREEAPHHPVREPARVALNPILAKLHVIRDETNISLEKYDELRARWKKISDAVGMINNNKVDHGI